MGVYFFYQNLSLINLKNANFPIKLIYYITRLLWGIFSSSNVFFENMSQLKRFSVYLRPPWPFSRLNTPMRALNMAHMGLDYDVMNHKTSFNC